MPSPNASNSGLLAPFHAALQAARSGTLPAATDAPSQTAQAVRGVDGYEAQMSKLSYRRAEACKRATNAKGRNDWLRERGDGAQSISATCLQGVTDQLQDLACNEALPVTDEAAEGYATLSDDLVTPNERAYDSGKAAERKATDGPIAGARIVQRVANHAGSVAETGAGPIGTPLGLLRQVAGDASEEICLGDGSYDAMDAAKSGATWGAKKLLNKGIGALIPQGLIDSVGGPLEGRLGQGGSEAVGAMLKKAMTAPITNQIVKKGKSWLTGGE